MADKSTQLIVAALSRAVADPAGVPLHGTKSAPGLFAATAPARQAAQRAKDDQFLQVVRTETHGKNAQEICALTEKGMTYLLGQASPKQVLEELVRALDAKQTQLAGLVDAVRQTQGSLQSFQTIAANVLQAVNTKSDIGALYSAWASKSAPAVGNGKPAPEPNSFQAILAILAQWQASGATEDCPLPELFRRAQPAAALTIGQFHDALRRLHEQAQIYLHPWTGPLSELPAPPYALLVGHEIAYYASIRK